MCHETFFIVDLVFTTNQKRSEEKIWFKVSKLRPDYLSTLFIAGLFPVNFDVRAQCEHYSVFYFIFLLF